MSIVSSGIAIFVYIIAGVISLLCFIVFVILILAVNQLHKLPDIKASLENIEKMLKYQTKLQKEKAEGKEPNPSPETNRQEAAQ